MIDQLTNEDLYRITGYLRSAEQIRWLKASGIPHRVRADGSVMTTATAVNQALLADLGKAASNRNAPRLDLAGSGGQ